MQGTELVYPYDYRIVLPKNEALRQDVQKSDLLGIDLNRVAFNTKHLMLF